MEKGQSIELRIEDMLDDGRAFGRSEGCAVFVSGGCRNSDGKKYSGAVPGDLIKARVIKSKKTSAEAECVEILEASPARITAECPYSDECGGCSFQEFSYDAQKRLKADQLRAKLQRLGGIEDPKVNEMIGSDDYKYYRNKAVFAVGPHGEVGFMKAKSHFVMDIDDCMLQSDPAMACAAALRAFLKKHPGQSAEQAGGRRRTGKRSSGKNTAAPLGITQMTVRTAFSTGEVMAVLDSENREIPYLEELAEMLDEAVFSLSYSPADDEEVYEDEPFFSLESVAVIHKGRCRIEAGKPTITEEITRDDGSTVSYEISPQSFFQVNTGQIPKLYDKAAEYADLKGGETVLDLYCGAGTIGIWLLEDLRHRDPEGFENTNVIGIESVKPAVLDANRNSVVNGLVNTRYICGRAEEELPGMMGLAQLYKWNEVNERVVREPEIRIGRAGSNADHPDLIFAEKADVAVLDPPRAGCGEALLAAVAAAQPDRIVYVSCDPGTLARDIKYLAAHGYEFVEATPIDNFPMTAHTECVCVLKKYNK